MNKNRRLNQLKKHPEYRTYRQLTMREKIRFLSEMGRNFKEWLFLGEVFNNDDGC